MYVGPFSFRYTHTHTHIYIYIYIYIYSRAHTNKHTHTHTHTHTQTNDLSPNLFSHAELQWSNSYHHHIESQRNFSHGCTSLNLHSTKKHYYRNHTLQTLVRIRLKLHDIISTFGLPKFLRIYWLYLRLRPSFNGKRRVSHFASTFHSRSHFTFTS